MFVVCVWYKTQWKLSPCLLNCKFNLTVLWVFRQYYSNELVFENCRGEKWGRGRTSSNEDGKQRGIEGEVRLEFHSNSPHCNQSPKENVLLEIFLLDFWFLIINLFCSHFVLSSLSLFFFLRLHFYFICYELDALKNND